LTQYLVSPSKLDAEKNQTRAKSTRAAAQV
jgi:hypothetical protein